MKKLSIVTALAILTSSFCTPAAALPERISAKSAILTTAEGDVIYEKNCDEKLPMASTTKIMTCVVAAERCRLDDTVTITAGSAGKEGSSLYMKTGDTVTVRDLIYAAMLRSANDAASALAVHVAGDEASFAEMMNETATKIGMDSTHFSNPHGLPADDHYTTARDFARLAAYALKNDTVSKAAAAKEYVVTLNGSEKKPVKNHNRLLSSYDGAIGMKTGFTKASGRCLVSAATRDGVTLICVTLSDPDDWRDHTSLLDYGFEVTEHRTLLDPGDIKRSFHAFGEGSVLCTNVDAVEATVFRKDETSYLIEGDRFASLPVKAGDSLATVTVFSGSRAVGRVDLVATEDLDFPPREGIFERIKKLFGF